MPSRRRSLLAVLLLAAVPLLAQSPLREGQWELMLQMNAANAPAGMPPMKFTQCVTKEQISNPMSMLPKGGPAGADSSCKQADLKQDGNKLTFKMSCAGAQPMTMDGEMVFDGDSYNGTMNMTTAQGTMQMKMAAKRLGDCPPGAK